MTDLESSRAAISLLPRGLSKAAPVSGRRRN